MNEESTEDKRSWLERLTTLLIREPKDRKQLIEVLRDAEERDILSAEMLSMLESVVLVAEMQVREVMVPKSQMVVIEHDSPFKEIIPLVIESGHSRFPVVNETKDNVIGILLAKDLLKYCFENTETNFDIKSILRPAVFVPQSKRLDILLKEFRINRNHMAIVLDEYGYLGGLVTIENVLEQIVGDIEDEYDIDEEEDIKKMGENIFMVKAATPIDEFNEYFATEYNDNEFDTIGGLVIKAFGYFPKKGEVIKIEKYQFKVMQSDSRRIYLLEVKPY